MQACRLERMGACQLLALGFVLGIALICSGAAFFGLILHLTGRL
jgi:hypothetical protein